MVKNKEFSKSNILLEALKNKKNVEDIINKLESELSTKDIAILKDLITHHEWEIAFSILCDILQEKDIFISKDIYKNIEKTGKKFELMKKNG